MKNMRQLPQDPMAPSSRPPNQKVGRPAKLAPEITAKLFDLLNQGVPEAEAAEQSGIDRSTFFHWLQWGKNGDDDYTDFYAQVQRAKAKREATKAVKRQSQEQVGAYLGKKALNKP